MKFKKILLSVAILIIIPFILLAINRLLGFWYDCNYVPIDDGPSSAHYVIKKINITGALVEHTAFGTGIDSMKVDTIVLTKTGKIDTTQKPAKVYKTYSGKIYLDTLQRTIKMETVVSVAGKGQYEQGANQSYFYTADLSSKVIHVDKDSTGFFKHCLLLKDEILPFQAWLDSHQPIYLKHFTKEHFDSGCLDPFRGLGSPTGGSVCYIWAGTGYFNLSFKNESILFKLPCASRALFFSNSDDFETGIAYYTVPLPISNKFNIAFIVYDDMIYLIRAK